MKVFYECNGISKEMEVKDFYMDVAKELAKEEFVRTKEIKIEVPNVGYVMYQIVPRDETGFITEVDNTLPSGFSVENMTKKVLTCVDPETNAYKFYELTPRADGVTAGYGRMGVEKGERFGRRSHNYPLSMFWIKYQEKISKGYVDHTDLYVSESDEVTEKAPKTAKKSNSVSARLFTRLREFAGDAVREAKVHVPITKAILERSRELLSQMYKEKEVSAFNDLVLELVSILQRPVKTGDGTGVLNLLARDENDFKRIIQREDDLIQAMDGSSNAVLKAEDFSQYDIKVFEATEKQKEQVLSKLSDQLKGKVKNIYRVIPKKQQEAFNEYLKQNNIKKVKQLWHGSRNQNWLSIMKNSLQLNPNAIITGKMFGNGIYFAPSSMKSWNYTSFRGTSWAKGNSDVAYMGLYTVAYGKPYDVDSWSGNCDYKKMVLNSDKNCLHAHAGSALRNDEIIFYNEAAMVLNYIVEFE